MKIIFNKMVIMGAKKETTRGRGKSAKDGSGCLLAFILRWLHTYFMYFYLRNVNPCPVKEN